MLVDAQLRLDAAQEAVDNLAADATPEEEVAARGELVVAQLALTAAKNLPENQPPCDCSRDAGGCAVETLRLRRPWKTWPLTPLPSR